jgi:hypothetical protein
MGVPSCLYVIEINGETYKMDKDGIITDGSENEVSFESLIYTKEEKKVFKTMEGHTGVSLKNLVNMINSKESLLKKVFDFGEDILNKEFVENLNNKKIIEEEDFKTTLGKYINPGVDFDFSKRKIAFKFFDKKDEAYITFANMLNDYSMKLKFSSSKPTETDNEKFTMRTWLIRLGFIGKEYKDVRNVMMKNLKGNGAFRFPKK